MTTFLALWRSSIRYLMIPVLCGLGVLALLGIFGSRWFRHQELRVAMRHEVEAAANVFDRFFTPIRKNFDLLVELGSSGILDLQDSRHLDPMIAALMRSQMPHVHQVIIVGGDGSFYVFPQDATTETPANEALAGRAEGDHLEQRRWYEAALATSGSDRIYWTPLYTFETTGLPGITGAISYHVAGTENRAFVVAMKIRLVELRAMIQDLGVDEDSRILMMTDNGVQDFDPLMDGNSVPASQGRVELDSATMLRSADAPLRLRTDHGIWWIAARQSTATKVPTHILLITAEASLLERSGTFFRLLLLSYLFALAVVAFAVIMILRRSRRKLESLAALERHTQDSEEQIRALIRSGETDRLEFKSSLRWNLKANRADKNIELACLKTMVAFMNTEGGTLLVGVTDEGEVAGIEADMFPNEDKFLLHFNNLIKEHIGLEFSEFIAFSIKRFESGSVLVVDCGRSSHPVFLRHGSEEEFYIRVGPGSRKLPTSKVLDYARTR